MSLLIDLVLLGVLGLLIFLGWKRGFAESVLRFGRLILAIAITLTCGSAFSALLNRIWIHPAVYARVHPTFMDMAAAAEGRVDALVAKIPAVFRPYVDVDATDATADLYELAVEWSNTVSQGISGVISSVVGYVLLFVLAFILLTVAIFLLRGITKLPVIRTVDKLLGIALGAVSGILLVILLAVVLGAVLEVSGQGDLAEQSWILRLFN